jgi:hypothetical protein
VYPLLEEDGGDRTEEVGEGATEDAAMQEAGGVLVNLRVDQGAGIGTIEVIRRSKNTDKNVLPSTRRSTAREMPLCSGLSFS